MVRRRIEKTECASQDCDAKIWVEIEAAATRRPEIAELVQRMVAEITRSLVTVFARIAEVEPNEAERRFAAHARLIVMLVQNASMRCGSHTDPVAVPDRDLAALIVRTIDNTLAEVAAAAPARTSETEPS